MGNRQPKETSSSNGGPTDSLNGPESYVLPDSQHTSPVWDLQPIETSSSSGGSSESQNSFKYQVFLSFRGPDVRRGFIDHLYHRLIDQGLTVFLDNIELPFGEEIQRNLDEAIVQSQVSVITLSPTYADSRWCLDEVVKIMECKASSLDQNVLPVFYNVEPTEVRHQSGKYAEAFVNHEIRFKDDMTRVFKYKTALGQLADLRGLSLEDVDGYEGKLADEVIKNVKSKLRSSNLLLKENIFGRDSVVQEISTWLQGASNHVEVGMIYGAVGMGKSTISQLVYNNNSAKFTGSCFVADFQKGTTRVLEQIISDVSKKPSENIHDVDSGLMQLKVAVGCRKTLLILDDVDDLTRVKAMFRKRGFFYPGSKIIITTRNQEMRKVCRPVKEFGIDKLDDVPSYKLFFSNAFKSGQPTPELMTLSNKIIKYCDGHPLALCTLASSLYDEPKEKWEYILEKLEKGSNDKVHSTLRLSFDSLDIDTKELFLDIAHYFNGAEKDYALTILDGLTPHMNVLFSKLVARCLVTVDGKGNLIMHQLIQEMAREVVRQEASDGPGHLSRLLKCEESFDVLVKEEGTKKVMCVCLDPFDEPSAVSPSYRDQSGRLVKISTDGFKNMENLKFLRISGFQLSGSYSNMPKKIKCLEWKQCLLQSIPSNFKLDELVVLHMERSRLVRVWESTRDIMVLKALKIMNLSGSRDLAEISDLSGCPALERIILQWCTKLVEVHESITQLTKLTYINVADCISLRKIPCSASIFMDAYGCEKLEEIGDNIKLQFRKDIVSGWAEYIGYSDLNSLEEPRYKNSISKVLYQSGIFSVFLLGDHIAKWFTTIGEGPKLTYIVPSLRTGRIRAFNICCVYHSFFVSDKKQLEVQIQNQSSTCKWLFIPVLHPKSDYLNLRTWLTHWPITQHRRLNAGDTLEVTFRYKLTADFTERADSLIKCGIEVLYDDEFREEDAYTLNKDRKGPSQANFAIKYDTIFRNSDLSKHEIEAEPGVYQFRGPSVNLLELPKCGLNKFHDKTAYSGEQLHVEIASLPEAAYTVAKGAEDPDGSRLYTAQDSKPGMRRKAPQHWRVNLHRVKTRRVIRRPSSRR